jgi:surface antigen
LLAAATCPSDLAGTTSLRTRRRDRRLRGLWRALVLGTAVTAASTALVGTGAPAWAKDDYPWRTAPDRAVDPWGFTMRQCVSWTAFKLAQRGMPLDNRREAWGSAANWDDAARRLGHGIGSQPVPGSIAHWNPGEGAPWYANGSARANGSLTSGSEGHVGYVTGVHPDGSAVVQQYNGNGGRSWSIVRVRAPRYLYVGVTAPV